MRKLLLILLLIPFFADAQVWQQNNLEYGHQFKGLKALRAFLLPLAETTAGQGRDTGAVYYRLADSSILVWTGSQWRQVTGSGPSYTAGLGIKIDGSTIRWADSVSTGHVVNFFNGSVFDIRSGTNASNYSRSRISVNGTEQLVTQTDGTTSDILLATSGISLRRYGVAVSRMLKVASTIDFSNSAGTIITNSFGADSSIHYKKLVYGDNYRSLFTDYTLVDKGYVDSLAGTIAGGSSVDSSAVFLGTLFNGKSFSAVTPLLNDGATVAANAENLDFSGGANTYTQTVNYDQYTALDRWFIKDSVIASEKTGTSYGFGLGLRSYSASQLIGIVASFNMTNDANSGKVTISTLNAGTPTVKATSTALTWSAGDTISLSFERNRFVFTAIVRNITTNSAPITLTYTYVYETNDGVPNTGRFSIYSLGGNFSVVSHRISSRASKFARALFVGDSKTSGQFGTNEASNWPVKLESNQFNPIVIDAGPSDRLLDMINKIPEYGLLLPKALIISAPSNDVRDLANIDTITNRYDRLADGVEALGIPVYHMLGFYEPGINQLALIAHIRATYPANRIIDTYTPTTQSGLLNADNVHPNQAMNDVIVTTVQNSFIIPTARMPYYTLPANTFLPYSTKSTIDTTNGTMSIGGLALNEHSQASDNATFKVRRGTKYWAFTRNGADVANSFALGDTSGTGNFRIYNTTTQTQLGISAATGTLAFVTANTNRYTISNAGAHAFTGTTYTYSGSTVTKTLTGEFLINTSAANQAFGVKNSVATNLTRMYVSNNGSLGLIMSQNGSTVEMTGAAQGDMNIRAFTSGNDKKLFIAVGSAATPVMTLHPTQEVNIGTTLTRDASAKLRIESTTQGFLPPKMTGAQAEAISSPTEGLMVYATDGSGTTITSKGWWGYDGAAWVKLN